jgi:predicted membrane protein
VSWKDAIANWALINFIMATNINQYNQILFLKAKFILIRQQISLQVLKTATFSTYTAIAARISYTICQRNQQFGSKTVAYWSENCCNSTPRSPTEP